MITFVLIRSGAAKHPAHSQIYCDYMSENFLSKVEELDCLIRVKFICLFPELDLIIINILPTMGKELSTGITSLM